MQAYDYIIINLAHKQNLDYSLIPKNAVSVKIIHELQPNAKIDICLDGYDDDGELPDIQEARDYIRCFSYACGMNDWKSSLFQACGEDTKALLISCNAIDEPHPFTVVRTV